MSTTLTVTQRFELAQLCVEYEEHRLGPFDDCSAALNPLFRYALREGLTLRSFDLRADGERLAAAVMATGLAEIVRESGRAL